MTALARIPDRSIPDVEITKFRRWHVRKVLTIERKVYPRPWTAALFFSELSQRGTRSYIVARHGIEVVGYAGMMFTGLEAHVTNIAVDPEFHGRRVGTRLLLRLVTEAIARGAKQMSLEVRVSNHAAQAMYRKFGFDVVDTRKGYYVETREDAYVMLVQDIDSTLYRHRLDDLRADVAERLEPGGGSFGEEDSL